jgi:hypothetical protein
VFKMSKIGLLFFVYNTFQFENEWSAWCSKIPPELLYVSIIEQSSTDTEHSEWVSSKLVRVNTNCIIEGNPTWKSLERLSHMHKAFVGMLREQCTHVITLSDRCLPVVEPDVFVNTVVRAKESWIDVHLRPRNGYTALNQFMRIHGNVCKGDRFMMLVREDLQCVVDHHDRYMYSFAHSKYVEEVYVPTILLRTGRLQPSARVCVDTSSESIVRGVVCDMLRDGGSDERVAVASADGGVVVTISERPSIDQLCTDDIVVLLRSQFDRKGVRVRSVHSGEIRAKKPVMSVWNNSYMYPNSYVWNDTLVRKAASYDCMFVQVVVDIDREFWTMWLSGGGDRLRGRGGTAIQTVDTDVKYKKMTNNTSHSFDNDMHTEYMERIWPEQECWLYAKRKLTTLTTT